MLDWLRDSYGGNTVIGLLITDRATGTTYRVDAESSYVAFSQGGTPGTYTLTADETTKRSRSRAPSPSAIYRSTNLANINLVPGATSASSTASTFNVAAAFSDANKWRANTTSNGEWVQRYWSVQQRANRIRVLLGSNYTRVPIFYLHRSGTGTTGYTSDATLRYFIQYAKSLGFQFVKLSQAIDYLRGGALPAGITKPLVLGTDDGYDFLYDHIYPVLQSENVPISLWMLTAWAGQPTRTYDANSKGYVSRNEIETMIASGNLELHCHTHDMHGSSVSGVDYYVALGVIGHPALGPQYNTTTGVLQREEDWEAGYVQDLVTCVERVRSFTGQTHALTFTAPNHIITPHTAAALRAAGIVAQTNISFEGFAVNNVKGTDLMRLHRIEIDNMADNTAAETFLNAANYDITDPTRSVTLSVYASHLTNPNALATTSSDWDKVINGLATVDGVMWEWLPRYGTIGGVRMQEVDYFYKSTLSTAIKALRVVADVAPSGAAFEVFQVQLYRVSTTAQQILDSDQLARDAAVSTVIQGFGGLSIQNYNSANTFSLELLDAASSRLFGIGAGGRADVAGYVKFTGATGGLQDSAGVNRVKVTPAGATEVLDANGRQRIVINPSGGINVYDSSLDGSNNPIPRLQINSTETRILDTAGGTLALFTNGGGFDATNLKYFGVPTYSPLGALPAATVGLAGRLYRVPATTGVADKLLYYYVKSDGTAARRNLMTGTDE
ncbi:polysaccharide deacetylase family protein [Deinococcus ruber]|uniref:polysaccharide deacetylase family protein n=1 Tax=Deinococcus ruber TaxID=1848197 RepID=UPI001669AB1E|nr:polysaccharide deacetylase family protein [Deinococcus ruber]